ncbi:MAG: hypothetical protein ACO24U_00350, partial [Prochlorococcaceae cyanobacterium]
MKKYNWLRLIPGTLGAIAIATSLALATSRPAFAAEEFTDLQCLSDIKSKDLCNVSFYRKFMKLNFVRTGRSVKINYADIIHWNYSDSSLRKIDYGLA